MPSGCRSAIWTVPASSDGARRCGNAPPSRRPIPTCRSRAIRLTVFVLRRVRFSPSGRLEPARPCRLRVGHYHIELFVRRLGQDGSVAGSIEAVAVQPEVLTWARRSIGLEPVAASRKLGLPDDRVERWESGDVRPTIAQLRRAATVYRRPLAVFFLPEPPSGFDAMRDFRRVDDAAAGEWSPELHDEYRRALTQRENVLELAELEDETPRSGWKLEADGDDETLAAAARARLLEYSPTPLPAGRDKYSHLNTWISALEEAGVLVLATRRGGVDVQEMRAFSLYFDEVPVIVVNGSDAARGRLFSIMHEYAHLLLHTGGLCDAVTDLRATTPDRRLEARCNAIAASILMPAAAVSRLPQVRAHRDAPEAWDYDTLRDAASVFGVSAEAFLRRLSTLGHVPSRFYAARRAEFVAAYEDEERSTKARGGDWYRNTARDLGKGYIRRVADAWDRRVIDSFTAATFLDVKVDQIPRLARNAALPRARS